MPVWQGKGGNKMVLWQGTWLVFKSESIELNIACQALLGE